MKFAENLRKYREIESISQEELAEKIFVSRQTISNWENNKSYPDVNSLALLSKTFNTSIDNLIKGDIEIMKEKINQIDIDKFNKLSRLFSIILIAIISTYIPLTHFFGQLGYIIYGIIVIIGVCVGIALKKLKIKNNIHTYREIVAFTEGKKLDEISQAREDGKRVYQKILLCLTLAFSGFVVSYLFRILLNL